MAYSSKNSPPSCPAASSLDTYSELWRSFTVCVKRVRKMHSKLNHFLKSDPIKMGKDSFDNEPMTFDNCSGWIITLVTSMIVLITLYALVVYLKNRHYKVSNQASEAKIIREGACIEGNKEPAPKEKTTEIYKNVVLGQHKYYLDKYKNSCENITKIDSNSYQNIISEQRDMIRNWELMRDQEIVDNQDKMSNQGRVRNVEELTAQDETINQALFVGQEELVRSKVIDHLGLHDQELIRNQDYERIRDSRMENQELRICDCSCRTQTRMHKGHCDKVSSDHFIPHYCSQPSPRYQPDPCNSSCNVLDCESEVDEESIYNNHLVQSLIENTKLQAREEIWQAKEQLLKELRDTLNLEVDIETKFNAYKADVEKEASVNLELISVTLKNLTNSTCGEMLLPYAVEALKCLYAGMSFGLFIRKKTGDNYENTSQIKLRRSI